MQDYIVPDPKDAAFFGHPRGLGWLAATELWERFSYYGMQGLLVLYLVHRLLLPGHVEHIWGFAPFRSAVESLYGPLSAEGLGSAIFGLYAGFVWMTPILGGLLADRLTGRTPTIIAGGLLMAAGHFLMAFDQTFLVALACLLIGVGLFKGNLATQVKGLYAADDDRIDSAYQIYYLAIQISVIVTPLVCGTLGEVYGWHWGFGAAGIGMVAGLGVYLRGRKWLPPDVRRGGQGSMAAVALTRRERRRVALLAALIPLFGVASAAGYQVQNVYPLWVERTLDMTIMGWRMPVTWLQSVDASFCAASIIVSLIFWRWRARLGREPDEITKMTLGVVLIAASNLVLVVPAWNLPQPAFAPVSPGSFPMKCSVVLAC